MKKILFTILIILFFNKVNAIENIKINGDDLIPKFDSSLKKYNYFTNSDKALINIYKSENEVVNGDGVFELNDEITKFIINSNISDNYEIIVYKNYQKKDNPYGQLINLEIEGYDIDFNSSVFEYDITINDEKVLNINYDLLNDNSYVSVSGNGNFNNKLNIITINVDDINIYRINVHKAINVSHEIKEEIKIKEMSYIEKEIAKVIIITISCILIFIMFYLFFLKNSLHV